MRWLVLVLLLTACTTVTPPAPDIKIGGTEQRCRDRQGTWTPVKGESGLLLGHACVGGK